MQFNTHDQDKRIGFLLYSSNDSFKFNIETNFKKL